jgi:hypothetical protein
LKHRPGNKSQKPNALSRMPNHQPEGEDNEDQVILKDEWFINMITDTDNIPILNLGKETQKEVK